MLGKNTILKAIHNKRSNDCTYISVWMLGKNTILKAIHNLAPNGKIYAIGVNAG